ncbi:unnamed protein product [Medioppia subpectinata]|uniref:F-box domain-containing protein n=1 Tax=Medioppia subpectinata TaxID=1979941 RepID=A0A7R9KW04_9ACAR|nr:unnamed protein product [Medioppia subpectinata]CAG2109702.1 unnamed protein product [Medioppia subpectinata]
MSKTYSKDCFDRFGDDLYEELLPFISLENRLLRQRVSKRFRRLSNYAQKVLNIDRELQQKCRKNSDVLKTIVNSCSQISHIYSDWIKFVALTDAAIDLVIDYCPHLIYITIDFKDNTDDAIHRFFSRFGPQLKTIRFDCNDRQMDVIMPWVRTCGQLTQYRAENDELSQHSLSMLTESPIAFKRLKSLHLVIRCDDRFGRSVTDLDAFNMFCRYYGQTVTAIELRIDGPKPISIQRLANGLSRLRTLTALRLRYCHNCGEELLSLLTQIGGKCHGVKYLRIHLPYFSIELDVIHAINTSFPQLNRLKFESNGDQYVKITSEWLSALKRLTRLEFYGFRFGDDFFADISQHIPRLHHLDLHLAAITDQALDSLSRLRRLRYFDSAGRFEGTDEGIAPLLQMPDIYHLHIQGSTQTTRDSAPVQFTLTHGWGESVEGW